MTSQTRCQSVGAWAVVRIVQHAKSMNTDSSFARWLTTFLDEKAVNLDVCFDVEGPSGMTNVISYGVVVEHMLVTTEEEQHAIKDTMVLIDFVNGDVPEYMRHLAAAIAI